MKNVIVHAFFWAELVGLFWVAWIIPRMLDEHVKEKVKERVKEIIQKKKGVKSNERCK
ncbi:MAG: hypothetical protein KAS91_00635 [Candidatus Pacebacteria bacterium]|nr:hypothetical protein [Candidatus Paceibacterota bacterium]